MRHCSDKSTSGVSDVQKGLHVGEQIVGNWVLATLESIMSSAEVWWGQSRKPAVRSGSPIQPASACWWVPERPHPE